MSFLWEGVKQMSQMAGAAALIAGQKTKLRGEMMLTEREMKTRQQTFGVELYDYVAPLAKSPDFFAANDKMTDTIRGPFLAAQREIAALMIKRTKLKEELAQAEVTRKAAFPQPATTFGEQVINTGKATAFTANEVKIKTEISMVDAQIRAHKEEFGEGMFATFVKLEDEEGWLPTVRDIRSMYDKARQDVDKLKVKMDAKERELNTIGTEGDVAAREFSTTATSSSSGSAFPMSYSSHASSTPTAPSPLNAPPSSTSVTPAPVSAPVPAMMTQASTTFGSFPASYAPPAPAPPSEATHLGSYSDHYRPPRSSAAAPPAPAASGLFLGMTGDRHASALSSASSSAPQQQPTYDPFHNTATPDPFGFSTSNGGPTTTNSDPFAFAPSSSQQQLPYDPFSNNNSAPVPVAMAPTASTASLNMNSYDNDPFADLVAGKGR